MPPKNLEGSSKFPEGHKVIDRTAQTAFVRVVTPPNFTFVIFNSGFFQVGKFDKYFLDTLIKKGFNQNNLKMFLGFLSVVTRATSCREDNFTCYDEIYKHKHSISNVFIFHIISFNDFWKCLRLRVSTWNFLAVYFIAFLVGFVGNPRVFLSLIFASIRSAPSLEILSTQNPPQLLPPWNCRSSQKFTDLN